MAQSQTASFQNVPIVGVDFIVPKGASPAEGRIRIPQGNSLSAAVGDLVLQSGSDTVTFKDAIPDLSTLSYQFRDGKREWIMRIQDRRAKWPSKRLAGHYNRRWRDGTIDTSTEHTASQLADKALAAVGEPGGTSLQDAKPEMDWDNTPANEALEQLAKYLPIHVVRTKADVYTVVKTGDGERISDYSGTPAVTPFFTAAFDSGPKTVKAICNKNWYDCRLELEAVGRDTDGRYKLINDLSYKPSQGWEKEWPTLFSGVQQWQRPFAHQSVFRCYRIKTPQDLPFEDEEGETITLEDLEDIDLDEFRLVKGVDAEPPLCFVYGTWWPYTDHYYNTQNCLTYGNEHWRFDKKHRMIVFDYPVFKAGSCVLPAELYLHTSFHLRNPSTKEWRRHTQEETRSEGQGEWVLDLPFLWRAQAEYYTDCTVRSAYDNKPKLQAEVQTYLTAWKSHYDTIKDKADVPFTGTRKIDLSGNIWRLRYRIGRGLTPETRTSEHYIPTT